MICFGDDHRQYPDIRVVIGNPRLCSQRMRLKRTFKKRQLPGQHGLAESA